MTFARDLASFADSATQNLTFRNAIINGNFCINQRGFTSTTSTSSFGFDRWGMYSDGGTVTYSAQSFTVGNAIAGYEPTNFVRVVTTGQSAAGNYAQIVQSVEDVRTFAGQQVTISFWAKASSGTPKIAIELGQNFGSGGSPSSSVNTYVSQTTLSTSWQRFTVTTTVPSISGKTLGTTANTSFLSISLWVSAGTNFNSRTNSLGIQSNTFDIWGVQVEYGSTATPFQTATGTIQGELAACQRYYVRYGGNSIYEFIGNGSAQSTTVANMLIPIPSQMRVIPNAIDFSTVGVADFVGGIVSITPTLGASYLGTKSIGVVATATSGLTQFRPYTLVTNNSTSGFLGLSAEL
jgi:hypothetical protein